MKKKQSNQKMKMNKTLKIEFKEDIRRIPYAEGSFEQLQKQIGEMYNLKAGEFIVKYKDDEGDVVTIGSEVEFKEALSCMKTDLVRLMVQEKEQSKKGGHCNQRWKEKSEKFKQWKQNCGGWKNRWNRGGQHQEHHHNHHHQHNQNQQQQMPLHHPFQFFNNLKEMVLNVVNNGELEPILGNLLNSDFIKLEHNHICDGCDTAIVGDRYHCKDCQDFDFCSNCHQEKLNSHDPNHQFEKISALEALKEALKNGEKIDSFFMPGKSSENVEEKKVHQAFCDRCKQTIVGIRWKCLDCNDFDFCNSCYLVANGKEEISSHLASHSFAKIEETTNFLPSFLQQKELHLQQLKKQEEEERERQEQLERERQEQIERERQEKEKEIKTESSTSPKYDFGQKLEDLLTMGFTDRQKNIKALIQAKGDIVLAIQTLLN